MSEADTTKDLKEQVALGLELELTKMIGKIEAAKVPVSDEWTDGLNVGMDWAIRILRKDKSAY